GNYIPTAQSGTAEIAIVVAHHNHRRGIATMVLKQLGSHARSAGTQRLVADVLAQNRHIRQVIADAGWPCRQHRNDDVINIEVDLTETSPPDHAATPRTAQLSVASSTR
ncbi:GNAT family N-acetyltransferase, partial [Mycolicibacterium sp. CBMA 361]